MSVMSWKPCESGKPCGSRWQQPISSFGQHLKHWRSSCAAWERLLALTGRKLSESIGHDVSNQLHPKENSCKLEAASQQRTVHVDHLQEQLLHREGAAAGVAGPTTRGRRIHSRLHSACGASWPVSRRQPEAAARLLVGLQQASNQQQEAAWQRQRQLNLWLAVAGNLQVSHQTAAGTAWQQPPLQLSTMGGRPDDCHSSRLPPA
jgi:hypothetical protein